jgi:hypothetical protein
VYGCTIGQDAQSHSEMHARLRVTKKPTDVGFLLLPQFLQIIKLSIVPPER